MTPKEKANELIEKYAIWSWNEAKECALITVDEILDTIEDERTGIFNMKRYWQEVKQEIEKL
jgi:hypothetical protein